jgi:prepilin-type N-terminal cleavage/methylation domain-containing protein
VIRDPRKLRCRLNSGFTLIEILVVVSMLAMLLAGILSLVTLIRQSSERADKDLLIRQEIRRFAENLRHDVHRSSNLTLDAEGSKLTLKNAEKSIDYEFVSPSTITRTLNSDSMPLARDRYGIGYDLNVILQSLDDGKTVQCTFEDRERNGIPIQIAATIGVQP